MKNVFKEIYVRPLCIWGGLAVVLFVVYVSCILPTRNHAKQLASRLLDAQNDLDKTIYYVGQENIGFLTSRAKAGRDRLRRFVTETDVAADCSFIVSMIAEQMKISDFTSRYYTGKATASIPNCKHVSMTQMNLSWRGSFPEFLRLINRLERHSPVIFVDSFSVMPVEGMYGLHQIDIYLLMLIADGLDKSSESKKLEVVSIAK